MLMAAVAGGCSKDHAATDAPNAETRQPSKSEPTTVAPGEYVVKHDVAYYTGGPQQSRPPDGVIPAGTEVRATSKSIGAHVWVTSKDGLAGYVADSALRPASQD